MNVDEYEDYLKIVAARKNKLAMAFSVIGFALLFLFVLTIEVGLDWIYVNALVEL